MITEIDRPTAKSSSRLNTPIKRIIVHDTAGNFPGCLDWLTYPPPVGSTNSSIHVLVTKTGEIYRSVPDDRAAWHCVSFNLDSLGIELERAKDDEAGSYSEAQLKTATEWIASKCKQYGLPLNRVYAHAELDPSRRRDPRNFPWYSFLLGVAEAIKQLEIYGTTDVQDC